MTKKDTPRKGIDWQKPTIPTTAGQRALTPGQNLAVIQLARIWDCTSFGPVIRRAYREACERNGVTWPLGEYMDGGDVQ